MRTSCIIANQLETGGYQAIYCHREGYDHDLGVGPTLRSCFTQPLEVAKLIKLGDLSSIQDTTVTAYCRDIGESWRNNKPRVVHRHSDLERLARQHGAAYIYVYKDCRWTTLKIT